MDIEKCIFTKNKLRHIGELLLGSTPKLIQLHGLTSIDSQFYMQVTYTCIYYEFYNNLCALHERPDQIYPRIIEIRFSCL